MGFNSITVVVFFACVLALHSLPLPWTAKKINLLIASYLFYAAWNPPFVILLGVSTVVDWYAEQGAGTARWRRTPACLDAVVGDREPGPVGVFQIRTVRARQLHFPDVCGRHRLSPGALRHRPARRHLLLYVRDHGVPSGRVPAPRGAVAEPARLRPVRDVLPAPGARSHHAPDGARASVRATSARQRAAAALCAAGHDTVR